ncbi:hypothetical protein BD410DRAFT_840782 [Rickenella mellea]|uniref:Ricin B lectin domain-containing protein n=1 Tax=Rickenella mellea TaxID=50990 RepID=A0A4Y7Q159_9AGAM|nr:hypothetical protein BD410DRAFT_840782 [Rickenella mellea]
MSIDPGAYGIQNVTHGNFAAQSSGSTVVAHADSHTVRGRGDKLNLRKLWSISRLDNGKYTLRNIDTNHYAASPNFPALEQNIIITEDLQQWDIKETGVKGRYVIYTTAANIDLIWGLINGQLGTPISLRDTPQTPSNQWELTKVDSWRVVGALREKLADLQNREATLLDEHQKRQDEHTKHDDVVERLNAVAVKASLDARHERERHLQAEAELKASYERASRRERARHLQAEAELKANYEKLLAESAPKTSQRRCICM